MVVTQRFIPSSQTNSVSYQPSQETADLVTFTEEILNKKLHFLCSDCLEYADTVSLNSILNLKKYLMGEVFHWGNSPGKFSGGD